MKKAYRVKSDKDFQGVFQKGKSFANRQFVVYVLAKPDQDHFRLGVSVGKKIGNAVIRNRIKRKMRQAVFELDQAGLIKDSVDFVVIARPPAKDMSVDQCIKSLKHVFKLAQLLQDSPT